MAPSKESEELHTVPDDYTDLYQILGIVDDATQDEIKRAHRKLAKKYSPDVNSDDPSIRERAKQIDEAYEILSDDERRRAYDRERKQRDGAEDLGLVDDVEDVAVDEDVSEDIDYDEELAGQPASEPEKPERKRAWYVVHSYSGYENKVKKNLEHRIESMGMHDLIFQVVVPTEEEVELRDGQRKTTERRVFPGYVLVEMIMTEDSWYAVRNTPGVTGFVGSANEPTPLRQEEVDKILKRMEAPTPKVKVNLKPGNKVRIVEGPFTDFMGTVEELQLDKGKVRILVSFFGRETPVELDFLQVERI